MRRCRCIAGVDVHITRAGEILSTNNLVHYLKRLGMELVSAPEAEASEGTVPCGRGSCDRAVLGDLNSCWNPPAWATIKINVDGAFNPVTGQAAIGAVARDYEGNSKIMLCRPVVHCRDAEEVEALACLEGLHLAQHWPNDMQIEIESDCTNLVEKVLSSSKDRSVYAVVIGDIKAGMALCDACLLRKIWREQNGIAHNLAKFAFKTHSMHLLFDFVPLCIQDLMLNDRYHCRYPVDVN
jgi:ribonuclease HI